MAKSSNIPVPSKVPVECEIENAETFEENLGFLSVVVAGRAIDNNPSDLIPPLPTVNPPPTLS